MKLRYLLIVVFCVLVFAPVLLFRAWPQSTMMDLELAKVEDRHGLMARKLTRTLSHYAEDIETVVSFLTQNQPQWGQLQSLADLMTSVDLRHLCVVDLKTGQVSARLTAVGSGCPDVFSDGMLGALLLRVPDQGLGFGSVIAANDGTNVMPVIAAASQNQVVIGTISTAYFHELGSAVVFGELGHAAIFDHLGNVLSHPLDDWVQTRRNISRVSPVEQTLNGKLGTVRFYSPAMEAEMVAGVAPVLSTGWGVIVPQPLAELEAVALATQQTTVYVLMIGVAAALTLALFMARLIVRPLEQLTVTTHKVAAGTYVLPPEIRFRVFQSTELRELYSSVHEMVLRLRKNQSRINKLAFFDNITGLTNRECFRRRIQAFLEDAKPANQAALLFLDLDGFKAVNDTMGHDVGDDVLGQVGARLNDLFPDDVLTPHHSILRNCKSGVSIARLGGDEFAVFLPHADAARGLEMAEAIRERIEVPFPHEDRVLTLGASIGIACFPNDAMTYSDLLKAADIAMYDAKRSGKNRARVYSSSPPIHRDRDHGMAEDLFSCGIADQIAMHYQPVYRAADMQIESIEGLIRWQHPKYGLLTPRFFFNLVAELGLQSQIDQMAFDQAISEMDHLRRQGISQERLSLNVPVTRLLDQKFVTSVLAILPLPYKLSFELTEPAHTDVSFAQSCAAIDQLRDAGIDFELDDFGSSSASLNALLDLAPHRIKLDSALIAGVDYSDGVADMIRHVVDMAHALEIDVVAKSVETLQQVDILRELGVDFIQGFALNSPLEVQDLVDHLRHRKATDLA
ncbi:MAG: EAL domain-containing protein [Pseudomonadota bacterium]